MSSEQASHSRIGGVELRVSDLEASAEFYSRAVGLETRLLSAGRAELGPLDGAPPLLTLLAAERSGQAEVHAAGLFHTAFRYPDRAGLAVAMRRVGAEMGWPITGASDHGVSEALYLDDPDGLGVELYRDRPRGEWPPTEGSERVHMFTAPLDLDDLAAQDSGAPATEASLGVDIGHVHLKVADPAAAAKFWTGKVGMDLMTTYGEAAAFLAFGGYHHHIGANSWYSAGAPLEPQDGPGLSAVTIEAQGDDLITPDGITIRRRDTPTASSASRPGAADLPI